MQVRIARRGHVVLDQPISGPIGYPANGDLEPPDNTVRWYRAGTWPMPGYPGPAVLVGHVSIVGDGGAFQQLGNTQPGDRVRVQYGSGDVVIFQVTAVQDKVDKDHLPVHRIWNATLRPELRLISCDPSSPLETYNGHLHHTDNIIVYADEMLTAPNGSGRG